MNGLDPGRRPHLLLGGWYKPGTGFTRVLLALVPFLRQHFRITWLGVGYRGEPFDLDEGVRVVPTNLRGGDMVGACYARENWGTLSPDIVFVLNDLWYLIHYSRELGDLVGSKVPMVGYLPLDGGLDDPRQVRELTHFSHLLTYTEWAVGQLRTALEAMGIETPVSVAGHGVNLARFYPLPGGMSIEARMERARELFRLNQASFVVLNASRPDPRKRLDLTLEAFARFAIDKPGKVRLCLHQAIAHPEFVEPLREQAERLGIKDRLLWFPPTPGPLDDAGLNALYNACAVGLNTAMGEGFGLVSVEHAATGAPQVLPAHPALCEIWRGAAGLIRPVTPVHTAHSPLLLGEVAADGAAESLQRLYSLPDHFRQLAEAGVSRCAEPDLKWEAVAGRILEVLQTKWESIPSVGRE